MAQRVDKTTITKLLRVSWEAVAKIVIDIVGDVLDDSRFEGLTRIGVDEVSYRKGHRYLIVVADHDREGRVVWAKAGKNAATLTAFFDELGTERVAILEAISLDMSHAFEKAVNEGRRTCANASTPYTAAAALAGAKLGNENTPLPFFAAAGLLIGVLAVISIIAERTTLNGDIT